MPVSDADQVRFAAATLPAAPASDADLMSGIETSELEAAKLRYIAPPLPGEVSAGEDVAMMIVGGAALVVGSVIGDDAGTLMMVGGGVVGLIGLYRYLR